MLNTDPTASVVNSDGSLLMHLLQTRQQFTNNVKTFRARGSIVCRKKAEDMLMLTEEKVCGFGARLEIFARKSLVRLAQKTGVSAISANCSKTVALAVHPCKTL
jgi:hypothetical protein